MDFDRLFTISAFEGLRLLRGLLTEQPLLPIDQCADVLVARSPEASAYDLEAAIRLHAMVDDAAPVAHVGFYRECVMAVMINELPAWAQVMTLGRGRFLTSIRKEEYRDIRSIFREAHLLQEPPSVDDVSWWDALKERYRSSKNLETMVRARQAERLSLEYERAELAKFGIDREVKWTAIEDESAGYDILSYRIVGNVIRPILIDAKSTIASPLRFNVSRNEWKEANAVGPAYRFHIWDLKQAPPKLFVRTVEGVRPHIPQDGAKGEWTNVRIPVAIDQKLDEIDADWT